MAQIAILLQNGVAHHCAAFTNGTNARIATMSKPDRVAAPRQEFTLVDAVCSVC